MLDVGDGHLLYWETCGNPAGTPAVWLHGGPGSGASLGARRNFDPDTYRVVLFDQRGCGRSRPLATEPGSNLSTNTTAHLIADIEQLRAHLGVTQWVVAGVSWGVTLAIAYAQRHPAAVQAMVLAAVTSADQHEIDWIVRDMGRIFPQEWAEFIAMVPSAEREGNLAAAYARLLADPDPVVRQQAAEAWCTWEDTHVSLMPGWTPDPRYADPAFRLLFATLVTHYWGNYCFLPDGDQMARIDSVADIPAVLIHGRYDISGPLDTAWRLHQSWPASTLVVLDDAGHGGAGFTDAVIRATDKFRSPRHVT
ncbi:prolyl aminopeptidase [Nakamurella sp. PAMC28650]|uniref:prolyl aminopeptidase n=1 Tax=Nakamurella sp. PAMC28650 TaxID=2762325 RepID=UPI00351ACEA1